MNLPGIITVSQRDKQLIERISTMMGDSFLEEQWTRHLLAPVANGSEERLRELSRALIYHDMMGGAAHLGCYALEDESAAAIGYLRSELGDMTWAEVEDRSGDQFASDTLTPEETQIIDQQVELMKPISVFDWEEELASGSDFIHFVCLAVDVNSRGSGAFRRLMTPFFDFADKRCIPCFLETYTSELEGLYAHVGFETVRTYENPAFPIVERCMMRRPR